MQLDTGSSTIVVAAVGGGVASVVTGVFALWNIWMTRRSEERRQIRELAVQVAIENHKIYKEISERTGTSNHPMDVYLIHAMYLVSALDGRLKTSDQIREHLKKSCDITLAATSEIMEINRRIQESRRKGGV